MNTTTKIHIVRDSERGALLFRVAEHDERGQAVADVAVTQMPDIASLVCMARPLFSVLANLGEHTVEVRQQFESIDVSSGDVMGIVTALLASGGLNRLKESIANLIQDVDAVLGVANIIGTSAVNLERAAHRKLMEQPLVGAKSRLTVIEGGRPKQ